MYRLKYKKLGPNKEILMKEGEDVFPVVHLVATALVIWYYPENIVFVSNRVPLRSVLNNIFCNLATHGEYVLNTFYFHNNDDTHDK